MELGRASGVLLHISSLPNRYAIGSFGKESYDFVDFLKSAGQSYWQVLPLSPTGFGDSPYQGFSVYAGNPYFISIDKLAEKGLLRKEDTLLLACDKDYVDYGWLYNNVYVVLRKAFENFKEFEKLRVFSEENAWLDDYAIFMALKGYYNGKQWMDWDEDIKYRNPKALEVIKRELLDEINFYKFLQYEFFQQWSELKSYAAESGIKIIGDMPIYTALDSADVWSRPELFLLDKKLNPTFIAGFPPDAFSEEGQLWGNPLYSWDRHIDEDFSWWLGRMSHMKNMFDLLRIDHFIGFARYYAVPYGSTTASVGEWRSGIGYALFEKITKNLGNDWIIAEDLGIITDEVRELLRKTEFYGMKVLQFAFEESGKSEYLPQNYKSTNCVVYTSTHDTNTIRGFIDSVTGTQKEFLHKYMGESESVSLSRAIIELAWKSTADIAITTIQDINAQGEQYRMNTPSTAAGNWSYRASKSDFSEKNADWLNNLTKMSARI